MRTLIRLAASLLFLFTAGACSLAHMPWDAVYQTSTIEALLEGVYDGETTFGELKDHGDTGLGTVNGLDGEMVEVDGKFYQIKADGVAYPVADSMKTPFAIVAFVVPDRNVLVEKADSQEELARQLDEALPSPNWFYAIRLDGRFKRLKTRSVPAPSKPYPVLAEALKRQATFEFQDVEGTLVGFRCPEAVGLLNVPGYHFHFITKDRKAGGHVLDLELANANVQVDTIYEMDMVLPRTGGFLGMRPMKAREAELKKLEQ